MAILNRFSCYSPGSPLVFLLTGIVCVVIFYFSGKPGIAQGSDRPSVRVRIEPPRIRGGMRYGQWAPLRLSVAQGPSAPAFTGTVKVTGSKGFRTTQRLVMSSGRGEKHLTVPVFCNSSLPVFRVSVLDGDGTVKDRDQQRIPSVFGPDDPVVGISTAFSASEEREVRERLSQQNGSDLRLITARREVLTDLGRWPGLFDLIYLKRSAELAVPVYTDPARSDLPAMGDDRIPRVQTVDPDVYDVFERPEVSVRRRQWMKNALLGVLFVLLAGLLFCFVKPSSAMNWAWVLLLPILLVTLLYTTLPGKPSVIRQSVSVRVSDAEYAGAVRDVRAAIFPHARISPANEDGFDEQSNASGKARRILQYPIDSIRRTIPIFYNENAETARFPELRDTGSRRLFYWPDFPENGYFVLQEFDRTRKGEASGSVEVEKRGNGIAVRNRTGTDLRNGWVRINGRYQQFGRIPEGETRKISRRSIGTSHVDSREQFLEQAFSSGDKRQRILRRWMGYVHRLYDRDKSFVVGVVDRDRTFPRRFPEAYGHVRIPELIFHRFRYEEGN